MLKSCCIVLVNNNIGERYIFYGIPQMEVSCARQAVEKVIVENPEHKPICVYSGLKPVYGDIVYVRYDLEEKKVYVL